MSEQDSFELRHIISVVMRWWWLIAACTILAAAITFIVASRIPPVYEADLTLLIEPSKDASSYDYTSLVVGERLALTYSQMIKGQSFLQEVVTKLKLSESIEKLSQKITVNPIKSTQLVRLSVQDTSPEKAALIANTLAEIFTNQLQKRETARYNDSLAGIQGKMDSISKTIKETQSTIDNLNAQKSTTQSELNRLSTQLGNDRITYQSLQNDSQNLQSTIDQLLVYIKIIEPASISTNPGSVRQFATVTFMVGQGPTTGNNGTQVTDQLITTYAEMLSGQPVLEAAIKKNSLPYTADTLAEKTKVDIVKNTQLFRLTVWDIDPEQAKLLAGMISNEFITQVQSLLTKSYSERLTGVQGDIDQLSSKIDDTQAAIENRTVERDNTDAEIQRLEQLNTLNRNDYRSQETNYEQLRIESAGLSQVVTISERAEPPTKPAKNTKLIYTMIAAMVVAIGSFGTILLIENINSTLKTTEDVSRVLGLKTLGSIEFIPKNGKSLLMISHPQSSEAESFRLLATNLRHSNSDRPIKTLLVSSSSAQEGKSLVAANLAIALAKSGLKVVLVDADLRIPKLQKLFELDNGEGLTESLSEGVINGRLRHVDVNGLSILTSGSTPANPSEIVGSPQMPFVIAELEKIADYVIIDSPPMSLVVDSSLLALLVDGVILVIRSGLTRSNAAKEALENINKVNAHVVGAVLNAVHRRKSGYYYYQSHEEKGAKFF